MMLPATPIDFETGIPLPLVPRNDLPLIPRGNQINIARVADWHHPFHPRSALINRGLGNAAVRNCRIQWATYQDHHDNYHMAFAGPNLPKTEEDMFRTVVFAAAGYIPDQAIGFSGPGRPVLRRLSEVERSGLWKRREIRVANEPSVGDFMINFVLRHGFEGIRNSTIDEFLHTENQFRRYELGTSLLGMAAHDAVRPVADTYRTSRERQLLPPTRAANAGRFVLDTMNSRGTRRPFDALRGKLTG